MIPAAIGAAFMTVGLMLGWSAVHGRLSHLDAVVLGFCAAWSLLGGAVITEFVVGVAFDRWRDRRR